MSNYDFSPYIYSVLERVQFEQDKTITREALNFLSDLCQKLIYSFL